MTSVGNFTEICRLYIIRRRSVTLVFDSCFVAPVFQQPAGSMQVCIQLPTYADNAALPACCARRAAVDHWRQRRRGCRGHIPQYFGWWGRQRVYPPPILLRTFGYSRPLLVALRSLSLKPISFGYKTPPISSSQAGGQSAHKARPPQP